MTTWTVPDPLTPAEAARRTEQARRDAALRARREAIPERPVHWPWLHGPTVPEISPGEAREQGHRNRARQMWRETA